MQLVSLLCLHSIILFLRNLAIERQGFSNGMVIIQFVDIFVWHLLRDMLRGLKKIKCVRETFKRNNNKTHGMG